MHTDPAPVVPADRAAVAPVGVPQGASHGASHGVALATLPQQVVLHAGVRLVVVDSWRLASAELLRDGAVQRLGQARAAGDARIVVHFDRIADDLVQPGDHQRGESTAPVGAPRELPASVPPVRSSLWHHALAPHPHAALAAAVLRRMQCEPGASHRLADVGAALGVSPYHVAHVFREQTGLSVHRYLLRLRLAVALDLLAGGAMNLSALALDLGFSSHSHFSSVFRRNTGMSPTGVRATFLTRPERCPRLHAALRATLAS